MHPLENWLILNRGYMLRVLKLELWHYSETCNIWLSHVRIVLASLLFWVYHHWCIALEFDITLGWGNLIVWLVKNDWGNLFFSITQSQIKPIPCTSTVESPFEPDKPFFLILAHCKPLTEKQCLSYKDQWVNE